MPRRRRWSTRLQNHSKSCFTVISTAQLSTTWDLAREDRAWIDFLLLSSLLPHSSLKIRMAKTRTWMTHAVACTPQNDDLRYRRPMLERRNIHTIYAPYHSAWGASACASSWQWPQTTRISERRPKHSSVSHIEGRRRPLEWQRASSASIIDTSMVARGRWLYTSQ